MGVYIGQSTKIYDRATGEVSLRPGAPGSVVVSGNLPSADGKYSAVLRRDRQAGGREDARQDKINELLRGD
jgi:2,3,4,5-tetrahydropyridine-2,6-dicarboxylate N-succinyltransferase